MSGLELNVVELGMFSLPGVKIYEYGEVDKESITKWLEDNEAGKEILPNIIQFKSDNHRNMFITIYAGD